MLFSWVSGNWFELMQTAGVVASLAFAAYNLRRDSNQTKIANLIALNEQYGRIWQELYSRPTLSRVFKSDVDLENEQISDEEHLFVRMLIFQLDTVRQAARVGMFVKMEGLQKDLRQFLSRPIPNAIWEKMKPFQNEDFVKFVERHRRA